MKTTKIHRFSLAPRGQRRGVMLDGLQAICVVFLFCLAAAIAAPAQTFTSLVSLTGENAEPIYGSLVQGLDGSLYGTGSGSYRNYVLGPGAVFKITSHGDLKRLHLFCSQTNCIDGKEPLGGLVLATDGNLYGTTYEGGANGYGSIFRINPAGELTTFYSFCSQANCADGARPIAGVVQGADGSLYGTTAECGLPDCGPGSVFKITLSGSLTTLYTFCAQANCADGAYPEGALVQANDGNFYGTTNVYGANGAGGTVFKISSKGEFTTLYSFCGQCADGGWPLGALVQATDGNLYGTTESGGIYGAGTVFRITTRGTLTTLHSFDTTDGFGPFGGLVQATDGNLYGTTNGGGANNGGTAFKISLGGDLTTLYNFCAQTDCIDGEDLRGGLLQATNGSFYGTTFQGGAKNSGTVFRVDMGFGPFVSLVRNSSRIGQSLRILGQGLTGTTAVSFNGTPATFTVRSDTYLTATVPAGATSGFVIVTTPTGTLTSHVSFRVVP